MNTSYRWHYAVHMHKGANLGWKQPVVVFFTKPHINQKFKDWFTMKVPGLNIRDFENARLKDLEVKKNNQFLGTK